MTSAFTELFKAIRLTADPKKDKTHPDSGLPKFLLPTATATVATTTTAMPTQPIKASASATSLREITLKEVGMHDDFSDCWVVIYDRVYDVTEFLHQHPGGEDVIMDHAGRDATIAFHGTGHSMAAIEQMRDYLIGELPVDERIFRTQNGKMMISGIPE